MKTLSLDEIIHQINGKVMRGNRDLKIKKVVTRLKRLDENTLFLDMWGRRNLDLTMAMKHHSFAIVTAWPQKFAKLHEKCTIIKVSDLKTAYWQFVKYYRSLFDIPVIGITGTCGKTTTKDMIKHILETRYTVQATKRSLNDSVYNLKYLTGIDESTEAAVIEMGVAYPGDLLYCCKHFQPQIGVITKIGVDHLMGCKSLPGYIQAKAELLKGMNYAGTLIINADDDNIKKIDVSPFKGKIISFGFDRSADFRFSHVKYYNNGMRFILHHGAWAYPLFVPGLGQHNVYNAVAAIAAVHSLGFPVFIAGKILRSFEHLESHVQIREGFNGCTVLDDTWSTNPTSIEAALEVLNAIARNKKTVIVLGFIDELGEHSAYYHSQVGEKIAELGTNLLVTVGPEAKVIADRALEKGMKPENVIWCHTPNDVFEIVAPHLDKDTVILIKTSMHISAKGLMKKIFGEC